MTRTLKSDTVIQSRPCIFRPMWRWTIETVKKQLLADVYEIGSFTNFAIFTGKHLCWGLFLIKLHAFRSETFLERDSNWGVSCGYCKILKSSFFYRTPPVAISGGPVSWVSVLWFRASTCFRFWSRTYTKCCKNNSLLSRDKIISSLLELIDDMLSISEFAFDFDEKFSQSVGQITM